ncbi:hypothetical protein [Streptomyces sp. NPDC001665]
MSLLLDLAHMIAPRFSFFADRLADGMMERTVERISDRTLEAGEGAFRSLVGRDAPEVDDETALTPETAGELDRRLGELTDEERAQLASAILTWLRSPEGERHGLVDLVAEQQREPAPASSSTTVTSYGNDNTVMGNVETFNQHVRRDRP